MVTRRWQHKLPVLAFIARLVHSYLALAVGLVTLVISGWFAGTRASERANSARLVPGG